MGLVEWLAVIASPFLFGAVLYFIKDSKDSIGTDITNLKDEIRTQRTSMRESMADVEAWQIDHVKAIDYIKDLIHEQNINHLSDIKEVQIKINDEITRISRAAIKIESTSQDYGKVLNLVNEMNGKIIFIETTNEKQNKILGLLIDKIKTK